MTPQRYSLAIQSIDSDEEYPDMTKMSNEIERIENLRRYVPCSIKTSISWIGSRVTGYSMYIRRQADFGTGGFHEEAACPSQHWYRPSRIARCKPGRVGAVLVGRFGNGNCRRERARPSATSPGRLRRTRRPTVPGFRKSKKTKLKTKSITNDYTFPHSICVYARGR